MPLTTTDQIHLNAAAGHLQSVIRGAQRCDFVRGASRCVDRGHVTLIRGRYRGVFPCGRVVSKAIA